MFSELKVNQTVINANKVVHAELVKTGEYQKSPHFRKENQRVVREILLQLSESFPIINDGKVIDFGCGTGFMINLVKDIAAEVHGVDICREMMERVDLSSGNVFLHESIAEATPFESDSFDLALAYSFMDHLTNYKVFLEEVYRVLKKGGLFFSGLNPNRDFIQMLSKVENEAASVSCESKIVNREIDGALYNGKFYLDNFGIDPKLLEDAEPIKTYERGFSPCEVINIAREIGFSDVRIEPEWFLGQGSLLHSENSTDVPIVSRYLTSIQPMSNHLFKYLRFFMVK